MAYQLRPYQQDLISKIAASWFEHGNRRVMAQLSCGGGKTVVFSSIVDEFAKQNLRCLVLAHRTELINQAVDKLENIVDEPVGVIKAGIRANYDRLVQVGSVQSMKSRMASLPNFDLIVIDEAHRTTSAGSYGKILDYYPNAKVLGVTATPIRLDGKGFRGVYDDLICCEADTSDLIMMGALSQYKYYACEKPMSVLGLKKRGGDFKTEEIEEQNPVEVVANQVIESYKRHQMGKQAIVFATSVSHSIAIAEALRQSGIRAHHLDGMSPTPERVSAMELFRNREIQILTNCGLFDEGLDIPDLYCAILARPTASLAKFIQMAMRPLRPCEGKEHATIIDLADNYERHGMPDDAREWTLDGIPKKQKKRGESKRERNVVTNEVETISLFNTGTEYVEIAGRSVVLTPELIEWMRLADAIIAEGIERDFKPGWAAHRLLASDIEPPLEAWRYLGKKLGYHVGWHKYKHDEWIQNHGKKIDTINT
jgi:superfamily II DNA or RNA helicase